MGYGLLVIGYFCLLFSISWWTGRKATNETFYRGNRQSPWYMVAFGMIGASISGVTFVSVPGMVNTIDMTYLQTCLGFILGYILVAFLLLPLYYRLNLTCKSLRDAQKDMCTYGVMFFPANLLFLSLGILLTQWYATHGITLPAAGDELLPTFITHHTSSITHLTSYLFVLGILAASFSSADSAMTALTTSFCVDICRRPGDETLRKKAHILVAVVFTIFILLFKVLNSTSIIDAIYILCSYTYGPLLGLFAYGLLTKRPVNDRLVPYICIASPILCYLLDWFVGQYTGYHFGYELLMLNGMITFLSLSLIKTKSPF